MARAKFLFKSFWHCKYRFIQLLKIRKICRNYGITIESSAGPATISFSQIEVSPGPQPIKPVTQPIQQKSPGGNSYFEFFKSYSDGNESGGNISGFKSVLGSASESNKNSGLNIGTTQSINKFEYNYSDTSYGFQPGVNVSTSSQDYYKPSYEYGQSNMNFDYNVSGVSKLAEIWCLFYSFRLWFISNNFMNFITLLIVQKFFFGIFYLFSILVLKNNLIYSFDNKIKAY